IESAAFSKAYAKNRVSSIWRCHFRQVINGLGVQVAAESLKLRAKQYDVGLIDLLRGVAAAWGSATEGLMGAFDLIQGALCVVLPISHGLRRHWTGFLGKPVRSATFSNQPDC